MKNFSALFLAVMALGILIPSYGQETNVINCPSGFASSGVCGVSIHGGAAAFWNASYTSGSQSLIVPTGCTHCGNAMNYQTQVNVQAFSTTFTFIPNGWNLAFVLQNNTNSDASGGSCSGTSCTFAAGAGCEAGFYQAFDASNTPPNNIFALELDSQSYLGSSSSFTYSSVQIYQQGQSPCNPDDGASNYYLTNKISTSPAPLTSPASSQGTTKGDTYSVTLDYTGTNLVMNMYDVSAGGSCPGASCFSYTWNGVNVPSLVGSTTAYLGLTGGTNAASSYPLYLNSLVYTVLSPAATPTFSQVGGTYGGTQSITISDSSSGAIICYNTTGAPATNGTTGCASGSLYTGAISVTSGQTIYAVAGGTGYGDGAIGAAAYRIGSTASQPTFSPASGSYNGNQTVTLTAAQGGVICYSTTGSPATNGSTGCTSGAHYGGPITVSSDETLYAAAGGTGFTDSAVGSSAYTISPFAGQAPANSPTYSPLTGSYAGTQSVTLASTTTSSYICYTLAASPPVLLPQTNNEGGCITGTLYSGPVSVSSSQTLYTMAGTAHTGPPSALTVGNYTITGNSPGTPTGLTAIVIQ